MDFDEPWVQIEYEAPRRMVCFEAVLRCFFVYKKCFTEIVKPVSGGFTKMVSEMVSALRIFCGGYFSTFILTNAVFGS